MGGHSLPKSLVQVPFTLQDDSTVKCVVRSSATKWLVQTPSSQKEASIKHTQMVSASPMDNLVLTFGVMLAVITTISVHTTHARARIQIQHGHQNLLVTTTSYCESANEEQLHIFAGQFFVTDKLWDGQQCDHEGTCCTTNSIPRIYNLFQVTIQQFVRGLNGYFDQV